MEKMKKRYILYWKRRSESTNQNQDPKKEPIKMTIFISKLDTYKLDVHACQSWYKCHVSAIKLSNSVRDHCKNLSSVIFFIPFPKTSENISDSFDPLLEYKYADPQLGNLILLVY